MTPQFFKAMLFVAVATALCALLLGCAGFAGYKSPEETAFVKASQGKAKGVYSWFTGSGNYCMLESHNVKQIHVDKVEYHDGVCKITWRSVAGKPLTIND